MTRDEIIGRVMVVMTDVFDNEDIQYDDKLTADNVEEWDSLSHIRLMVAVEREFGCRFSTAELDSFKNLGDLVDAVAKK